MRFSLRATPTSSATPRAAPTTRGSVLDTPPGPVGAVVLPDLDGSLRRPSLDAAEDTLRLAFQIATWAGHPITRQVLPDGGRVVVQSREPSHHAITSLVAWDPGAFWRAEAPLRVAAPLALASLAIALGFAGMTLIELSSVAALPAVAGPVQAEPGR